MVPGHRALTGVSPGCGEEKEEGKGPNVMPTQLFLGFV